MYDIVGDKDGLSISINDNVIFIVNEYCGSLAKGKIIAIDEFHTDDHSLWIKDCTGKVWIRLASQVSKIE